MAYKQSDLLSMYRDEIRRSKKWRSDSGYDDDWKRFISLYTGKHWDPASARYGYDRLIVNMIFSTINTMSPAVSVNNPRFVVNARNEASADTAIITEEVLNYLWRTWDYQDEFRLAVLDWLICGHGWCKVGYKFVKPPVMRKAEGDPQTVETPDSNDAECYGIDDRDNVPGNVESEMHVSSDRPFLERISVFDMFVDPDARHPKEMRWIAQRVWRPLHDVQVDSRYSATARKRVSGKSWSRWNTEGGDGDGRDGEEMPQDRGPQSYVEVIEFYDISRNVVATFALDADGDEGDKSDFLIKPQEIPYAKGHPFEMIRNYEVPDHFYPIGDVQQIESLQLELNQTRTQTFNHRKKFSRKWLYKRDAFDSKGVQALESDLDNTLVPVADVEENLANVILPMPAVITPPEFYEQSAMITNDMDRISGVSDYQRGGSQANIKRTATEAAMIQDSANAKAQDRLAKIESSLARLGERVIALMQQYMTGQQVARVTAIGGGVWINYPSEWIQGEFDFEVAAGSTEPMNETFRRQSALQLVDASMPFLEMGVANPQALYMHILQKGFGIKDTTRFISPPQPQMQPGMEQGMQPPMQPGMEQGMPPQQGPLPQPEAGPQPMDPGSIPPQLLQMLMSGGGPAPAPMG